MSHIAPGMTKHKNPENHCGQQPLADKKGERQEEGCLPGRTPGPRDKGASPGKAQLSHSLGTTCLWLHKTAIPK